MPVKNVSFPRERELDLIQRANLEYSRRCGKQVSFARFVRIALKEKIERDKLLPKKPKGDG